MTAKVARMVGFPTSSTASTEMSRMDLPGFRKVIVPDDVLHHHDGVVHQNPDGEDQGERVMRFRV